MFSKIITFHLLMNRIVIFSNAFMQWNYVFSWLWIFHEAPLFSFGSLVFWLPVKFFSNWIIADGWNWGSKILFRELYSQILTAISHLLILNVVFMSTRGQYCLLWRYTWDWTEIQRTEKLCIWFTMRSCLREKEI